MKEEYIYIAITLLLTFFVVKFLFKTLKFKLIGLISSVLVFSLIGEFKYQLFGIFNTQKDYLVSIASSEVSKYFDNLSTDVTTAVKNINNNLKLSDFYKEPLSPTANSTTNEGSVKYGAIIELGDLDHLSRSTYAHIRLKDSHEPGNNGEKRNETINVNPAGWRNFKIANNWANNRLHLVGYQFSGLNDELRNLVTGTSYLNKGSETAGANQTNIDGMLYYEQQLDNWLRLHPNYYLDLYVKPVYDGNNTTPTGIYMQWVGFDSTNKQIEIKINGHSKNVKDFVYGVYLPNISPSYKIDYTTGEVTKK